MGFRDTQVRQQQRHRFGGHGTAAIGMDGELSALDALSQTGLRDQGFRQYGGFPFGDHPPHHVTAVDIQDHVQVIIRPFRRPQELGNIPTPELIWGCSQ